jgi:CheY-like chemotaxis protein
MNAVETSSFGVVIAEDSADDRFLIKSAIGTTTRLQILAEVADGEGVLAYFQGRGEFGDRQRYPLPDLLLLDLHMPGMDGFQVLEWLNTQPLGKLTTVVLTDSIKTEHLKKALDLGADFFQVKPRSSHELKAIIHGLEKHLSGSPPLAAYATARPSAPRKINAAL